MRVKAEGHRIVCAEDVFIHHVQGGPSSSCSPRCIAGFSRRTAASSRPSGGRGSRISVAAPRLSAAGNGLLCRNAATAGDFHNKGGWHQSAAGAGGRRNRSPVRCFNFLALPWYRDGHDFRSACHCPRLLSGWTPAGSRRGVPADSRRGAGVRRSQGPSGEHRPARDLQAAQEFLARGNAWLARGNWPRPWPVSGRPWSVRRIFPRHTTT